MNAGEVDASGTVPQVYFTHNAVLLQDSGDCIGSYSGECRGSTVRIPY